MDIVWIVATALLWVATVELVFGLARLGLPQEPRP
jgi:hypothetical protein